jgi:hypothetical protein
MIKVYVRPMNKIYIVTVKWLGVPELGSCSFTTTQVIVSLY